MEQLKQQWETYLRKESPYWWEGYWGASSRQSWAEQWLKRHWFKHEEAIPNLSEQLAQFFASYQDRPWYVRWWFWLFLPIDRLQTVYSSVKLAAQSDENAFLSVLLADLSAIEQELSWFSSLHSPIKQARELLFTSLETKIMPLFENESPIELDCLPLNASRRLFIPTALVEGVFEEILNYLKGKLRFEYRGLQSLTQSAESKPYLKTLTGCETYRRQLLLEGFWSQETSFSGWLGRHTQNKELAEVYSRSLQLTLEACLQGLRSKEENPATRLTKLLPLLREGSFLEFESRYYRWFQIGGITSLYRKLVTKLLALHAFAQDALPEEDVAENYLVETTSFFGDLGDLQLAFTQGKPTDIALQAEAILKQDNCLSVYHGLTQQWQSLQQEYPLQHSPFSVEARENLGQQGDVINDKLTTLGEKLEALAFKGSTFERDPETSVSAMKTMIKLHLEGLPHLLASYAILAERLSGKLVPGKVVEAPASLPAQPMNGFDPSLSDMALKLTYEGAEACRVLGIDICEQTVTWSMVREAFRNLILYYHPDKQRSREGAEKPLSDAARNEMTTKIKAAYDLLGILKNRQGEIRAGLSPWDKKFLRQKWLSEGIEQLNQEMDAFEVRFEQRMKESDARFDQAIASQKQEMKEQEGRYKHELKEQEVKFEQKMATMMQMIEAMQQGRPMLQSNTVTLPPAELVNEAQATVVQTNEPLPPVGAIKEINTPSSSASPPTHLSGYSPRFSYGNLAEQKEPVTHEESIKGKERIYAAGHKG